MIIRHPDESKPGGSVCQCLEEERGFSCLFTDLSNIFYSFSSLSAIFFSDDGVLKMQNEHCFHRDNTSVIYFLEIFLLAGTPGSVLCCIQLASHRQHRRSSTGQTKRKEKLNRSFHGWAQRTADPPPETQGYVNPYSLEGWRHAKHSIFKTMTHIGFCPA